MQKGMDQTGCCCWASWKHDRRQELFNVKAWRTALMGGLYCRAALTSTAGSEGGPQWWGFHHTGGCWRDQVSWALKAYQSLLGLGQWCCCSAGDCNSEGKQRINLWSKKGTRKAELPMTRLLSSMRRISTHTIWRLVRLPMVGESMPERLWLGASLPSNQTNSHRTLVRTLNARG